MLPYQGHENSTSQSNKGSRWPSCSDELFSSYRDTGTIKSCPGGNGEIITICYCTVLLKGKYIFYVAYEPQGRLHIFFLFVIATLICTLYIYSGASIWSNKRRTL